MCVYSLQRGPSEAYATTAAISHHPAPSLPFRSATTDWFPRAWRYLTPRLPPSPAVVVANSRFLNIETPDPLDEAPPPLPSLRANSAISALSAVPSGGGGAVVTMGLSFPFPSPPRFLSTSFLSSSFISPSFLFLSGTGFMLSWRVCDARGSLRGNMMDQKAGARRV